MVTKFYKRLLSVLLAVMMLFSLIPAQVVGAETVDKDKISDYETFIGYLGFLEELAYAYTYEVDASADPLGLVIKYIRTGVDRYNTGSWGIMAGYEDENFAAFVEMVQEDNNNGIPDEEKIYLTSLKNIENMYLPNGDYVDIGHMFGTMDITYTNKTSINHADVGGWAGDLVDLLSAADTLGVTGTVDEMVDIIATEVLGVNFNGEVESFSNSDIIGDLDAFYIMNELDIENYYFGDLTNAFLLYFTEDLTMEDRAEYFIKNRLDGVTLRDALREKVLNTYIENKVVSTLEGTREFNSSNLNDLRKACCYTFADYICKLAGDYVEATDKSYFDVFSTTTSNLAPGIVQDIKQATTTDGKQMVYYLATADLTRDDVHVYANYNNNDPAAGWEMQRVIDQANAAQKKYGNPESDKYIENYNVIAATNGAGFNMSTGEPGGLLVMGGVEYHPINANGFFGILKDGTPIIASTDEYNNKYKGQVAEGIAGFGATLIKDGKIVVDHSANYTSNRASRTAVGITKTGKVVLMVLDGRQEPFSCGGSYEEIAQIMLEAGCYNAVNLDGGGSTTFVAKQEGDDALSVVNRPSDGFDRSVSTSLMMVSTAPSSTAFHHAVIESNFDYLTPNSSVELSAFGVSATGNAADLPEGTYFAVADENIGTITEDGIFTAKAYGDVEVYLMLGEEVLATKALGVVVPETVFFTKTAINAVYGSKLELPIKATYFGKAVVINPSDVSLSMSNKAAGSFEGLHFIGKESSGVKVVNIIVTLANSEASATSILEVSLFNQGEAVFDFDQATAGDRQLAWDRKVTNATTDDSITYNIIDPTKDMETSYIFAIDMSKIEIPQKLNDLVYMLPGADIEGANAWMFLCQLAQRVSDLTTVTPVIKFDKNFELDYSNITLVNDYFELIDKSVDTEKNELTLTLKWKRQTQAIDVTKANPICIVSGAKLTPKADAAWTSQGKLNVVNSGSIGYKIYLRASALYSFAQKEENQAAYDLYPFVNTEYNDESGAYFSSIYKEFEDTYTLNKALKNGWVTVKGGAEYYVDGVKTVGIALIEGYYYDFGEDGVCLGQNKYTGVFFDESAAAYRYSKLGVLQTGWHMIGDKWHYFHSDYNAKAGYYKQGDVYYNFNADGSITNGVWAKNFKGTRYYYGPTYYLNGWLEIDGANYLFKNGYRCVGFDYYVTKTSPHVWYDFGDDGSNATLLNGVFFVEGEYRYFEDGIGVEKYLVKVGNDYYFATYNGKVVIGRTINAWASNCDLPKGTYTFGDDGKMIGSSPEGEIVNLDGVNYYFVNGKGVEAGLVKIDGDYYCAGYKGKLITNMEYKPSATICDLPVDRYEFGPDGKMYNGIVDKGGKLYYYENGKGLEKGLVKYNGDYYFTMYKGEILTNRVYNTYKTSCDLPNGKYEFGADGKMLQGIVEKDGKYYYYENGVGVEKGLVKVGSDYYFTMYKGEVLTNRVYNTYKTSCDLPNGLYEFGADGKMLQGIVEKDGKLYYYENGKGVEKGLIKYEGDYYFTLYKGEIMVNRDYNTYKTSCDLPNGRYEFGSDGKMLQGIVEKGGKLYYYENGKGVEKGLVKVGDDYYFTMYKGEILTNRVYNTYKTSCDLPNGKYEFGADGKMLQGIVEKDGELYYYDTGVAAEIGLFEYDGNYYFAAYKGKLVVGKEISAYKTSCDLPTGKYEFGADGKMLQGIVEKGGKLYYYENGKGIEKGLFLYEGHYYFAMYKGELVVNRSLRIWQGNGILIEQTYTFNELGQIIA